MSLRIEQDCPQCGGPLELEETERLLRCNFCNVQSFLSNTGPLHFILPRKQPDPYTIYAPYLRFKGTVYTCLSDRIEHHLTDVSMQGIKLPFLPVSLGLRPQAMKMRFAASTFPGSFLKKSVPDDVILARAAKSRIKRDEEILHQAYVGEALNLVYLPLSIRDETIFDGVLERILSRIPENTTPFAEAEVDSRRWNPVFLPALCPKCGWSLEGEPDSVVLFCTNCNSGWQAGGGSFSEVTVTITPAPDNEVLFIPFWNFQVTVKGIDLATFADFVRITNQVLVVKPEWEKKKLHFVCPAFKVRPQDFLRLSTQMTLSQRHDLQNTDIIPAGNLYPVNLDHTGAEQSLKIILANSAVSRSRIFPALPEIDFAIQEYFLQYLPFAKTSHELQQENLDITINQRVLNYGRSL
jgi:hypothetical protein